MDSERWHRVEELFQRALDSTRASAFNSWNAPAGRRSVRREVESLLAQEKKGQHFIDSPALEVVGKLVAAEAAGELERTVGSTVSHYRIVEKLGGAAWVLSTKRGSNPPPFRSIEVSADEQPTTSGTSASGARGAGASAEPSQHLHDP